ncbi:MAG: hypothetical protein WD426_05035 [Anditalea sp.]
MACKSLLYGLSLLLFSLSLLTVQKELGPLALVVAALGIFNGFLFATVIAEKPIRSGEYHTQEGLEKESERW